MVNDKSQHTLSDSRMRALGLFRLVQGCFVKFFFVKTNIFCIYSAFDNKFYQAYRFD